MTGETTSSEVQSVLISEEQIRQRVAELGEAISHDYTTQPPIVVGVLKGVLFFMADLLRAIRLPVEVDFIAVTSYSQATRDRGLVRLIKDLETPIQDRPVLFVEDMVDTGLTLNYLLSLLRQRGPSSLEVCTLLNRPARRLVDVRLKYIGFDLPDEFVVGYGLDYRERYRNLPHIAVLKPNLAP